MMATKERVFAPLPATTLDALVPADDFYRHLERTLDLAFVRDLVREYYAAAGRPSVDPVVFFKLQLILFFEGLRSERKLMETVAFPEPAVATAEPTTETVPAPAAAVQEGVAPPLPFPGTAEEAQSLAAANQAAWNLLEERRRPPDQPQSRDYHRTDDATVTTTAPDATTMSSMAAKPAISWRPSSRLPMSWITRRCSTCCGGCGSAGSSAGSG